MGFIFLYLFELSGNTSALEKQIHINDPKYTIFFGISRDLSHLIITVGSRNFLLSFYNYYKWG